ncbi:MAG: hypothetical protein ACLUNO_01195 [Oscillospiraceae bacterium]
MMWSGCYTKGKNMAHAVVFAEHTVKGMRDPWYIDEHSGAEYVKTWNDALRILDDGTPKKVVLYPNAECQVLDQLQAVLQALQISALPGAKPAETRCVSADFRTIDKTKAR